MYQVLVWLKTTSPNVAASAVYIHIPVRPYKSSHMWKNKNGVYSTAAFFRVAEALQLYNFSSTAFHFKNVVWLHFSLQKEFIVIHTLWIH